MCSDDISKQEDTQQDMGFIPNHSAIVSLPFRQTTERSIIRRNGGTVVSYHANGKEMAYGKMPRILDAMLATSVITNDDMWDASRNRWTLGTSFFRFIEEKLGIPRGGSQYEQLRKQLANWLQAVYLVARSSDSEELGGQFLVGRVWHSKWFDIGGIYNLRNDNDPTCWIEFDPTYIAILVKENPVPVSFDVIKTLNHSKSPLALDIYFWLNRRMSYLRRPTCVTWEQLREQFGGAAAMSSFKQTFKRALGTVCDAWPELTVTVDDRKGLILQPCATSVKTLAETRRDEALAAIDYEKQKRTMGLEAQRARDKEITKHTVRPYGDVYCSAEQFNVDEARMHFEGFYTVGECPVCKASELNAQTHGARKTRKQEPSWADAVTDGGKTGGDRGTATRGWGNAAPDKAKHED